MKIQLHLRAPSEFNVTESRPKLDKLQQAKGIISPDEGLHLPVVISDERSPFGGYRISNRVLIIREVELFLTDDTDAECLNRS